MSDELRDRLSQLIDRGLYCWDSDTGTSMTDTEYAAQAIIDDLGLTIVDVPGGISDYSPFTGKPVVQPDRWYVDGERVFIREKQ